jgi:hypothetical protein
MTTRDVMHAFVWFRYAEDRPLFDPHWRKMFPDPSQAPARVDVVSELPVDFLVQVEMTARAKEVSMLGQRARRSGTSA